MVTAISCAKVTSTGERVIQGKENIFGVTMPSQ